MVESCYFCGAALTEENDKDNGGVCWECVLEHERKKTRRLWDEGHFPDNQEVWGEY